ncbi:MAG: helix-turn-helix domain-containing protein [Planctomycetaceae bacterium]|nr:helix-turn-helix domain-containing protein [Planctomycetaceae bacterium]
MSKKYLSLEETASALGIAKDELIRMRERGEIRGFADRGTWKFREEDVQQVRRSRQADSDPDVPMFVDDQDDSAIGIGDEVAEQPTIIRKGGDPLGTSDSEVKLVSPLSDDAADGTETENDFRPISLDSDSDVKLVGDSAVDIAGDLSPESNLSLGSSESGRLDIDSDVGPVLEDSDSRIVGAGSISEVRLSSPDSLDSDSDVALVSESSGELNLGPLDDALGSDSDVRLVLDEPSKSGSDSDVKLVQPGRDQKTSDSDVALLSDDDDAIALDFTPGDGESASVLSDESGLSISGDDSAMLLRSESGISLEGPSDSGVAFEAEEDEGITLDIAGDSGISLEAAADSGISLESVADSGISLEDSNEFGGTMPMMKITGDDDGDETAFEIPALKSDDSEFELSAAGSDNETAVFDLAGAEDELDDAVFDLDEVDDASDDFGSDSSDFDDDLEVADDILGEDDELDELDVFDADEDVFDEGVSPTGSQFAAPVGAVAVEQDWGAGTFIGLLLSTALLAVVGIVMFDLVHNIWTYQQPTSASSTLLDALSGVYGK